MLEQRHYHGDHEKGKLELEGVSHRQGLCHGSNLPCKFFLCGTIGISLG